MRQVTTAAMRLSAWLLRPCSLIATAASSNLPGQQLLLMNW
jgi:hypothetical protein